MKAVNYYVVVDKIKNEQKKVAGLIMTEDLDQDNRYSKGKVVSAGNLVEGIKDGDTIHYDKHAGHGIQYKDKLYFVIKVSDIVLVD
jgi:co-chaperonin GroES (HSP10)